MGRSLDTADSFRQWGGVQNIPKQQTRLPISFIYVRVVYAYKTSCINIDNLIQPESFLFQLA